MLSRSFINIIFNKIITAKFLLIKFFFGEGGGGGG